MGFAGALSLATPSSAAPVSNAAALTQAIPSNTTDVRWRGRGFGWGLGLGALGGAALGFGPYYGGYYYPHYAYYPGPYYGYGPGPYWGPRRYWGYRHRYWRHRYWRHW